MGDKYIKFTVSESEGVLIGNWAKKKTLHLNISIFTTLLILIKYWI